MSRSYLAPDEDHQPLTWIAGRPLYAAHVVVAVLALTLLATTLLQTFGTGAVLDKLVFDSGAVLSGEVWRILSYGLVNFPSISIAVDIALLLWFGREIERFLGRGVFLRLYAFIYFTPPLLLTALGFIHPMYLAGQTGALAVFVAFATLNPRVDVWLNIPAAWAAVILVVVYTLMAVARHDWPALAALWGANACAYLFVRHQQGAFALALPRLRRLEKPGPRKSSEPAVVRVGPARAKIASDEPAPRFDEEMAEVDALLDKINRSGIDSLTPRERERLAAAQARLARRYDHR